ncbi:MAG: hypothetical protein ACOC8F_01070, partial [Planctomycetota bacterium]
AKLVADARGQAEQAGQRLRELQTRLEAKQEALRQTREKVERLSKQASAAYTRTGTAETPEKRLEALEEYQQLQKAADAAAARRDVLNNEMRHLQVELELARLDRSEAQKLAEIDEQAMQAADAWRDTRREKWRRYRAKLAKVRRALVDDLAQLVAAQRALSRARAQAVATYEEAADEAAGAPAATATPRRLRVAAADVMGFETRMLSTALRAGAEALSAFARVPAPDGAEANPPIQTGTRAAEHGAALTTLASDAAELPQQIVDRYVASAEALGDAPDARAEAVRDYVKAGRIAARRIALQRRAMELGAALVRCAAAPGGEDVRADADALADKLTAAGVADAEALAGQLRELPGRAQVAMPAVGVEALAGMLETYTPPDALRQTAAEHLDRAVSLSRSGLRGASEAAQTAILDALAAAFLARARLATTDSRRAEVLDEAESSELKSLLAGEPPAEARRMPSLRRLRGMMGLKAAPAPVEAADAAGALADGGASEAGDGAEALPPATEPKDALRNMLTAVRNRNRAQFVASFDARDEQQQVLSALGDFFFAAVSYMQAMRSEYGPDAVDGDQSDLKAMMGEEWLDQVTIEVDGDTATATHPDRDEPLKLVKVGQEWKISVADMSKDIAADEADPEAVVQMLQTMTEIHREMTAKVGSEGYTAEKIKQELGQRMMEAIFGGEGGPGAAPPGGGPE